WQASARPVRCASRRGLQRTTPFSTVPFWPSSAAAHSGKVQKHVSSAPAHRQPGLLRRNPGFRALLAATFASGLGTWIAVVALTIDVYDRTGSAKWVSGLLVADFLPAVGGGLLFV